LSAGAALCAPLEPPHAVIAAAMQMDIATARLDLKIFFIILILPYENLAF
jgi:hypothetical protein